MAVVDMFAGMSVSDYPASVAWYEKLLGAPPAFLAHETEAVFAVLDNAWLYVELEPDHAGHAQVTLFVDDLDERVTAITSRGIEPASRETYDNGVRKVIYHDLDGNEIGFGGGPAS
ncbi:VOC family protein [Actinoplanes sp. NPDC051633]|uniref:VOC family protein n=1 Tax=Actinoplanes sp. NPDC051633 TaxID=3155670 RepID=UPI0034495C6C